MTPDPPAAQARIVLAADAFDAVLSERSYGTALSEADALAELRRHPVRPDGVAAFERVMATRSRSAGLSLRV